MRFTCYYRYYLISFILFFCIIYASCLLDIKFMAIIIKVAKPELIVSHIKEMIDSGAIDTWTYDVDGDFTHVGQWRNKAWFSTHTKGEYLTFFIIGRKNVQMELMEYSVFHGRFVELLLNHFSNIISSIEITSPLENELDCSRINL